MEGINDNNEPFYTSAIGTMTIHNEGFISYKPHKPSGTHVLVEMKKELNFLAKKLNGNKLPFISYSQTVQTINSAELSYMKKTLPSLITKMAVLVDEGLSKYIIHTAIYISRPLFPVKVFTNEQKALEWMMVNNPR